MANASKGGGNCTVARTCPGLCAGCGDPLAADALDLPDGARVHWERDQEFTCLIAYGFAESVGGEALAAWLGTAERMGDVIS